MGEVPGLVKVLFPSSHLCSQLLPLLNLSLHSSLQTRLWNSSSSPGFHSRPRVNMVCMDQTAPFPLTFSSTQAPAAPYGAHLSLLPVLLDLISSSPEGEFIPFPRQGSSVSWPLLSKTLLWGLWYLTQKPSQSILLSKGALLLRGDVTLAFAVAVAPIAKPARELYNQKTIHWE